MSGQFVTHSDLLIHEDTKEYPVTLDQIARRHVIGLGAATHRSDIAALGYKVVDPVVRPKGDVVTEIFPVREGDGWVRAYEVREFTELEKEGNLNNAKAEAELIRKQLLNEILDRGVAYDFGGEHGVQHIQMRTMDRVNITGMALMAARNAELEIPFCTFENRVVKMTSAEVVAMSDAAFAGYTRVMTTSWALRDMIAEATTVDGVLSRGMIQAELNQAAEQL